MTLKLEVGKEYMDGHGDKILIIYRRQGSDGYKKYVGINLTENETVWSYFEDGRFSTLTSSSLNKGRSIVSEWNPWIPIEPDTFPPVKPSDKVFIRYKSDFEPTRSQAADFWKWGAKGEASITHWRLDK